jgi:hypothetical protein
MLKKVLHFLGNTDATTSLSKERREDLHKARVIITTHEGVNNLAAAELTKGAVVIYDEAPANAYHVHYMTVGDTAENHMALIATTAGTIDEALSPAKRLGKRLNSGTWKTTPVYHLTPDQMERANSKILSKLLNKEMLCGTCSDLTPQNSDSEVGLSPQKPTISPTPTRQPKEGDLTHFTVSYIDFESFGAHSISILTACPEATSVAVLEKLSGKTYRTVESEKSKARRLAVAEKIEVVPFGDGLLSSCSKANANTKRGRQSVEIMIEVLKGLGQGSFAIAHSWRAKLFNSAGIPCVKLNQTGLNTFRDCTVVAVANLDFNNPRDRVIEECIFGEDFAKREKMLLAGTLGQSVMRSALRKQEPEATGIYFFDRRVEELVNLFVKGV